MKKKKCFLLSRQDCGDEFIKTQVSGKLGKEIKGPILRGMGSHWHFVRVTSHLFFGNTVVAFFFSEYGMTEEETREKKPV